jgi:ABC-2 type transport system ATP-binding protein
VIIELDNLSVSYGSRRVLDGITVQLEGGAIGLLGPNGAGKTTLLKTLLGFIRPDSGGARVLGFDVTSRPLDVRRMIGYMPENDCHIPGMNAVSFVAYAGQLAGMRAKDAIQRAHEILFYVGLGEARYRNVEQYSTGMKQRIKLAQALVHDPGLVFLDEPTNGLDPRGRQEMIDLIKDIATSKGIHVVLSSHLLPDVEWVCSDAVVIHQGKQVASGRIEDLKRATSSMYECRVKGPRAEFAGDLSAAGCECSETDDGMLRIRLSDGAGSRLILRAARDRGVQIRHLVPVRQSLEDVFMQVIGDGHADS